MIGLNPDRTFSNFEPSSGQSNHVSCGVRARGRDLDVCRSLDVLRVRTVIRVLRSNVPGGHIGRGRFRLIGAVLVRGATTVSTVLERNTSSRR